METSCIKYQGLFYAWNNLDDTDKAELNLAIDKAWERHTSLLVEGGEIVNKIFDYLNEFVHDNNLPNDFLAEFDEEDLIFEMLEICES